MAARGVPVVRTTSSRCTHVLPPLPLGGLVVNGEVKVMIFKRAACRRTDNPGEDAAIPRSDRKDALTAMVAHAWGVTHWHTRRAESRDRLALQITAFAGVLLALMPQLDSPLSRIDSSSGQAALSVVAVVAAALLVLSVVLSLLAVAPPVRKRRADTTWPKQRWKEYRERPTPAADVLERQMHALVGDPDDPAPYKEIAEAADRREKLTRWAVIAMAVAVLCLGVVLLGLLLIS